MHCLKLYLIRSYPLIFQGKLSLPISTPPNYCYPIYKKKPKISSLQDQFLLDAIPALQQSSWYQTFLKQSKQHSAPLAISHHIQLDDQHWRFDLLPLTLAENEQQFIGSVVTLQSFDMLRIDAQQFNIYHSNTFDEVVAKSKRMAEMVAMAKKFAFSDAPLLIQGETGTGKEFIAKACHQLGNRRDQQFIAVNCAGLPPEDTEAEMFGYNANGHKPLAFLSMRITVRCCWIILPNSLADAG